VVDKGHLAQLRGHAARALAEACVRAGGDVQVLVGDVVVGRLDEDEAAEAVHLPQRAAQVGALDRGGAVVEVLRAIRRRLGGDRRRLGGDWEAIGRRIGGPVVEVMIASARRGVRLACGLPSAHLVDQADDVLVALRLRELCDELGQPVDLHANITARSGETSGQPIGPRRDPQLAAASNSTQPHSRA